MATGVITLLLALSQGNREGWSAPYIVCLFIIASVALVLFVLIELWVRDPLVDLRLYRNATYSMASLVGVLLGLSMYGSSLRVAAALSMACCSARAMRCRSASRRSIVST